MNAATGAWKALEEENYQVEDQGLRGSIPKEIGTPMAGRATTHAGIATDLHGLGDENRRGFSLRRRVA